MTKFIIIHSVLNQHLFEPRDGTREANLLLRDQLAARGYLVITSDEYQGGKPEWVFFYDAPSVYPYGGWRGPDRWLRDQLTRRGTRPNFLQTCRKINAKNLVFFMWEPPSTTPENYRSKIHTRFSIVFTWNDTLVDGKKFHKMVYPQLSHFPAPPSISFSKKKLLINISANKISFHPHQLYSARRESIRYFEQACPDQFDLYGYGWDHLPMGIWRDLWPFPVNRFASYRGTVKYKWAVMPRYKFSLCYENIQGEPGYVSEKIFDSLRCGCVPIYWGAPNITDYVDSEAFIDRTQFRSNQDLHDFISNISEVQYLHYQQAIQDYLHSSRFVQFSPQVHVDLIIDTLNLE